MPSLNFPEYDFKLKRMNGKVQIFDTQRNKYVALTPEEWVRQNVIRYLMEEKHFPAALLGVEQGLTVNGMKKRCDAVLFDRQGKALIIMEFKAPTVALSQAVFDQVAVYNYRLNVDYFLISNGLTIFCCRCDVENARYEFLPELPDYEFFITH